MTLQELLDNVGWSPKEPRGEYDANVFKWMTEATIRIEELDYRTEKLLGLVDQLIELHERNQENLNLLLKAVKGK